MNETPEEKSFIEKYRTRIIIWTAAVIIGTVIAVGIYPKIQDAVKITTVIELPGISIKPTATPDPDSAQEFQPTPTVGITNPELGPALEAWNGSSRVNVLVMGLDYRDWSVGEGPPRTDTMILFTMDPVSGTAGMLSIPRDLWVDIPGFEHGKINTAYMLGEAYQLPGGGPGQSVKTVEQLLGVDIHYFAQIDFNAFVDFIDIIGGVKLDVQEKTVLNLIGEEGNVRKVLKPGVQSLPGDYALAYVRLRTSESGDFGRAQRQQEVILAMRNQLLRTDVQSIILTNGFEIYESLSSGIKTNLSFDEAMQLAWMVKDIDLSNIITESINSEHVTLVTTNDGLDALKPRTEMIRQVRDKVFGEDVSLSPITQNMSTADLIQAEGARVAVYNASGVEGLANETSDYLTSLGIEVVEVGNEAWSGSSSLTSYSGKPYTLRFLQESANVNIYKIAWEPSPNAPADIVFILGADWANNNPMP